MKPSNKFLVYKLSNADSICGYDYLASNESHQVYISISDHHFSINPIDSEARDWLINDYKETQTSFDFDYIKMADFISRNLFEKNFSLIAYTNERKHITSIEFAFYGPDKYYELEYSFDKNILQKNIKGIHSKINFTDTKNKDVIIYKALLDLLTELNDIIIKLMVLPKKRQKSMKTSK